MKQNFPEIAILILFSGSILGIPPENIFDAIVRLAFAVLGVGYFQRTKQK